MASGLIGSLILWLIVAIIVIVVVVYLLHWLYHRSTKEVAFVRTGFGRETVVIDGGALVLPIIHEVTPVNLNVVRIPVARTDADAVMTRDRMRVDLEAEFFVRVIQEPAAVAAAASTLGTRTMSPAGLADLLTGKFVSSLRSVAAEMTVDEMHEKRGDYVTIVQERAAGALAQNGLELEFVAITNLDQTNLEHFNPANRFDAEGLTKLIETIEARRQLRNDIEQSAMVAIRTRNLEAEKETLKIEQESEASRLDQQRQLEALRAAQRMDVSRTRVASEAGAERSRIASEQETRTYEIAQQNLLEEAEIKGRLEVERAQIMQEQLLEAARIEREKAVREAQIGQKRDLDELEVTAAENIERARIASDRQLREARIAADAATEAREITRAREVETAKIEAQETVETVRIAQETTLDKARIDRDQVLRWQRIAQQQSIDEAELSAREDVERARIASERGLDEARIRQDQDLKRLEIERTQALELAELDRQISVLQKQSEEAAARLSSEGARARAVEAEEKVATVRETEIAKRIADIDRLIATKEADTARIAAEAEEFSTTVEATGRRLLNEAENILTEEARTARLRSKMIDHLEGIVRESVRPMERIEGIKILHVEGLGGNHGTGSRSPTDEVIESALRYRAQAPLIDEMLKEIGVANPNVARMGDLFRTARDAQAIARGAEPNERKSDT